MDEGDPDHPSGNRSQRGEETRLCHVAWQQLWQVGAPGHNIFHKHQPIWLELFEEKIVYTVPSQQQALLIFDLTQSSDISTR